MKESMESKRSISLPEQNELPLKTKESERLVESGESTVWKVLAENQDEQDNLIALKQVRKEKFATDEEMQANQKFYEFMKSYPDFGKFVPDTLYFKARMTPDSKPQAYRLQRFIEGKPLDKIKNEELYSDPELMRELLEFIDPAIDILRETREKQMIKPDFMRTPEYIDIRTALGGLSGHPRYSSNIFIADRPDANGRRVFFVDTAANADERSSKSMEVIQRRIVSPIEEMELKQWKSKIKRTLNRRFPEEQGLDSKK